MIHFPEFNKSFFPLQYSRVGVIGERCALIYEESSNAVGDRIVYGKKRGYIQFDVPGSKIKEFTKVVQSSESEDEFFIRLQNL